MSDDLKDLGKVLVRDVESQAEEFAKRSFEIGKQALGDLWDKEPKLRDAYMRASRMSFRGTMRALAGEQLPFDYWDNVQSQFSATDLRGQIIAAKTAQKALASFLSLITDALSALGGPAVGAISKFAKGWVEKLGQ